MAKSNVANEHPRRVRMLERTKQMNIENANGVHAARKEAGLRIDPEHAQIFWEYGQVLDPYGLHDLTDEERCIGRNYFARSPGSDVWVSFGELPGAVCDRLWTRMKAGDFDDYGDEVPF